MTDLSALTAAASRAQGELDAAKAEQAAADAANVADAASRSVAWSWATIATYSGRQAIASEKVSTALAAFSDAVLEDLGSAASKYIGIVRAMASANTLGVDLVKARHILRTAGLLPRIARSGRDPVGDAAPFPLTHGMARLPSFLELVTETLDRQRAMVSRAVSAEAPETYQGKASEAMKLGALQAEWLLAQEMESLLAIKVQQPALFAKLSAEEQADATAYEATRMAVGYDAPLPKIAAPNVHALAPHYSPTETARFHLYGQPGPDGSPLEPTRPPVRHGI